MTQGDPNTIVKISSDQSSIVLYPSDGCSQGTFDFNLIISLINYQGVFLTKAFQVTIINSCGISVVKAPIVTDIFGEVFTSF